MHVEVCSGIETVWGGCASLRSFPGSDAVADGWAEKRGGAWMDEVVGQSRLFAEPGSDVRLPVAHMV